MNQNLIRIPLSFLIYMALQLLIFRRIVLFDTAFCMAYIGFILFLPMEISTMVLMLAGFSFGLTLDMFQNSPGLHAGATVLVAFIRNSWLSLITPQGGYDTSGVVSIRQYGITWLLTYSVPLVLVHQSTLFFSEAGGFHLLGLTSAKVFFSLLLTLVVLVFAQLLPGRR